jgi:hypothetical protein
MKIRRITHVATLSLAIAAVAAPTAVASSIITPREKQDLVTPDARDAMRTGSLARTTEAVDRRSPDARDAADGRGTWSAPAVTVVRMSQPTPASSGTGLDWGDAAIGGGAVLGLMLVALGGTLAVMHRRHSVQQSKRPATVA